MNNSNAHNFVKNRTSRGFASSPWIPLRCEGKGVGLAHLHSLLAFGPVLSFHPSLPHPLDKSLTAGLIALHFYKSK